MILNNEFEIMWKEVVMTRYCSGLCLQELRKIRKCHRIVGVLTKIQTSFLQSIIPKHYHVSQLALSPYMIIPSFPACSISITDLSFYILVCQYFFVIFCLTAQRKGCALLEQRNIVHIFAMKCNFKLLMCPAICYLAREMTC